MAFDWSQYATGGAAARPDSFSGLDPRFATPLERLLASSPGGIGVSSAYRSPEVQAQLWEEALAKYGSESAARKWVAPPGKSHHNHGTAVDLKFDNPQAEAWAHENAGRFGLKFPMGHEPWHVELGGDAAFPLDGVMKPPVAPTGLGDLFLPSQAPAVAAEPQEDPEVEERRRKEALFAALPGLYR